MNGTLIQIFSWPGMKETDQGLALLGRTDRMQVWAQIFQSDVNRLSIGQRAVVTAETGGFKGSINATLASIISQVSARDLFAISGNNDVNARVVLVKLDLDPEARQQVERLSGLNVIVRFSRP
jgi:HlyD family secretion protein